MIESDQTLALVTIVLVLALGLWRAWRASRRTRRRTAAHRSAYPGDFTGKVDVTYEARKDGKPDPGEIVWTWVPFEEDHSRGKDRPVLLIGRDGRWLLGLQLTSKNHTDAPRHPRSRRQWMDIGTGTWDRERRPSEVRLDRIVRVDPSAVRREGAVLDRSRFIAVARSLADHHRW